MDVSRLADRCYKQDEHGTTALHIGARDGNEAVAALLLNSGESRSTKQIAHRFGGPEFTATTTTTVLLPRYTVLIGP